MGYWDTSCLLKLYVLEADSPVIRAHLRDSASLVTSEITRWELYAALRGKEARGDLTAGGARAGVALYDNDVLNGAVQIVALSSTVVGGFELLIDQCQSRSPPLLLRTLDAIHVACALVATEREMVSCDKRLRDAAMAVGLTVFPT
jgi:predicted nucleic acid-binding protein